MCPALYHGFNLDTKSFIVVSFQIRLKDASVSEQKNLREFLIKRQGKSYVLRADSDEECHLWIDHIQQCIDNVNGQECEFSDEEEYVPPVSPAVDTTDDKACKH